jgi:tetratricopeptide (TPR) repeat protein
MTTISATEQTLETRTTAAASRRWLYGAPTDLIIGCGLWSLPLLLITYWVEPYFAGGFATAFYALALVCNYPHYAATWYRACAQPADRQRYWQVLVWSGLLTLAGLLLVHAHPPLLAWVFTLYVFWSPWHYTGQNYGIALMFARRRGLTALDRPTTRWLWAAFVLPYVMLLLAFNSGPSADPLLLSAGLPPAAVKMAIVVLGASFLAITFVIGRRLLRQHPWSVTGPTFAMLATQAMWFTPAAINTLSGEPLFQARYSSGMLALLHSAQYLWITSYYARREQGPQWQPWRYAAVLFAVGIALFIPGPWAASLWFGLDFTTSFLAFTALINIHHFILDGAVWKLREPRIAAVLVQDQTQHPSADVAGSGRFSPGWRRFALTGAVVGLVLLAGLDVVKFVLGGRVTDAAALNQALKLNPNDALVAARLARLALAEGDRLRAREALERAIAINPYDADSQAMLGQMLIEQGEYDAAYRHYQAFHEHLPNDVRALVNLGTLAARRGQDETGIAAWERAVQLDPEGQPLAWANLGDAYMRANRVPDAIRAYEQALRAPAADDRQRLEWTLKLGDSQAAAGRTADAERLYTQVRETAPAKGFPGLASTAATRRAGLYAGRNQLDMAAAEHHAALQLAAESQEDLAQGAAWFEYALFMARQSAPTELVFAACLQAETHFRAAGASPVVQATVQARLRDAEAAAGSKAAGVRERLAEVLSQARAWQPQAAAR